MLQDQALGDDGVALEVLQVALGDELVQVLHALLGPGQDDDVLGLDAAGHEAASFQTADVVVELGNVRDGPPQPLHELGEDQPRGDRVVRRPVMVEFRQAQVVCHHVQLVAPQLRQHGPRHGQGVDIAGLKVDAVAQACLVDKAHVKAGVVGHDGPVPANCRKARTACS